MGVASAIGLAGVAGFGIWKLTPVLLTAAQALAAWTTGKDDDVFVGRVVAAFEKIGVRPIVPVGYTPGGSPLYPPPYEGGVG